MSFFLKSNHFGKLMCRPSDCRSVSINDRVWRIADVLLASTPSSRNQALKLAVQGNHHQRQWPLLSSARPKKRIKGPVDHPAELLIVMTDDPKGATRGDESHSTKKSMEGVLRNEWHIDPGGLA